ncbi:MAG: DUF2065 family protein [Xanthomonadaceae bacterium]|jgi:uncharacterized protein YjeT (DUF2065 family)|nr:DUF2065 family protein [Xanthomonadaceae bacterium]
MSDDLLAALCLVLVLEGAFLFIAPDAWKRAASQLLALANRQLRLIGGLMMLAGWLSLALLR